MTDIQLQFYSGQNGNVFGAITDDHIRAIYYKMVGLGLIGATTVTKSEPTIKPAAPADDDVWEYDQVTMMDSAYRSVASIYGDIPATHINGLSAIIASIRRGEVPGLTTTEQEKTRRQPLLDEIERLRAEMQQHREASARLIEVANDERDAAIARADAAERKLRDAFTQLQEDPIDTNKVIEDLSSAVDRERAAHAEAMNLLERAQDYCPHDLEEAITLHRAKHQNKDASK